MEIKKLLIEKKETILDKWIDQALATYPVEGYKIFKSRKDQFANPVGFAVRSGLSNLYKVFCGEMEIGRVPEILEYFIKIRSVQDFAPSEAVGFIFTLKRIVIEEYKQEKKVDPEIEDLLVFEEGIEKTAMMVFDLYMASREKLNRVRLNEFTTGRHIVTDSKCPTSIISLSLRKEKEKEISSGN